MKIVIDPFTAVAAAVILSSIAVVAGGGGKRIRRTMRISNRSLMLLIIRIVNQLTIRIIPLLLLLPIAGAAAGFELLSSIAGANAPTVAADHSTAVVVADAADSG